MSLALALGMSLGFGGSGIGISAPFSEGFRILGCWLDYLLNHCSMDFLEQTPAVAFVWFGCFGFGASGYAV